MIYFLDITKVEGEEIDIILSEYREAVPEKYYLPCYVFDICLHGIDKKVGIISFRVGNNKNIYYGGNIGYGVFDEFRGNHYAAKACILVKDIAMKHNNKSLIITCDPDNIPSRKTCEYLGAELLEIVDLPEWNEMYQMGKRKKCRFKWEI